MYSAWFTSTFLRVLKCLQIKERGPNFWGEPILQKVSIIWSPFLYLNFKNFMGPNWLSFIRFQCILHDSGVLFSESWYVYKSKRVDLTSWGNQFWRKSELFNSPPLYFNFKSFVDPKSLSFISFQCILYDSGVPFSEYSNFQKLKRRDLICWGESILQKVWIIWSPLLYFNFKTFKDPNSLSFIRF